ncbi:MAG: hypothetical protein CFE26_03420 [Verrucomicrobiales bacterium VVV1]|nr:MAG: hypothetical protein CFE26_03420 [Verrucomicrobiales bacterium VVV1]
MLLRDLPPDENGLVTTMAKGVNDLLNYYIQVADAKASIMIAGTVASATFLLTSFPSQWSARLLFVMAASGLVVSLALAIWVVIPRLPKNTGQGSVFWGDIANCPSASEYRDRFSAAATNGLLDDEYCILNYQTAIIVRSKINLLRKSILFFLWGILMAIPHHLLQS